VKRVVADTNALVSALQFGRQAVSEAVISETLRVLRDKFERASEWVAETERQLRVITRLVQPTESIQTRRDFLRSTAVPVENSERVRAIEVEALFGTLCGDDIGSLGRCSWPYACFKSRVELQLKVLTCLSRK
jgi:hypothetical protein